MALCPSVCPSVRLSHAGIVPKSAEFIELIIGLEATLDLSYTVLEGISKNKGTSCERSTLCNFVPNYGLVNFATARRPSQNVVNLGGHPV